MVVSILVELSTLAPGQTFLHISLYGTAAIPQSRSYRKLPLERPFTAFENTGFREAYLSFVFVIDISGLC